MTTEPPTAPEDTGLQQPAARQPMSRRRFLAVVGGTAGVVGIAGLAGRSLLGGPGDPAPADAGNLTGLMLADPGVEIVEVEPGFADAAVWNDQLLTLRADPAGTGIILRSETDGIEHPVDAPPDFTARCIGTIGTSLAIGGHRQIETGSILFESGPDFKTLAETAGPMADLLRGTPALPAPIGDRFRFIDSYPWLSISSDLWSWVDHEIVADGHGGSCGAITDSGNIAAVDRYVDPDVPDSIFDVALVELPVDLSTGTFVGHRQIPVSHGGVWGTSQDMRGELLAIVDDHGASFYRLDGSWLFTLPAEFSLLSIDSVDGVWMVSLRDRGGEQYVAEYGSELKIVQYDRDPKPLLRHRVDERLTIVSTGRLNWAVGDRYA